MMTSKSPPLQVSETVDLDRLAEVARDLRSPQHRQPVNPKACYRTRDVALFEDAASAIEALLSRLKRAEGALENAEKSFDMARRHIESGQVVDKDVHGTLVRARDAARQALPQPRKGGVESIASRSQPLGAASSTHAGPQPQHDDGEG